MVAVLALLVGAAYWFATRPERLRSHLLSALREYQDARVSVGDISFSFWSGLQVVDLVARLENASEPAGGPRSAAMPPILRVAHARVHVAMLPLLLGRVRPTRITARGATIALVRDPQSGAANWDYGPLAGESSQALSSLGFPEINIDQADVQIFTSGSNGQPRLFRRWIVNVRGSEAGGASADGHDAYVLRIEQVGGTRPDDQASTPRAAELRIAPGAIEAAFDWVGLETASLLFPPAATRLMSDVKAGGRVQVKRIALGENGLAEVELKLADVRFSLPIEDPAADLRPAQRFVQVSETKGSLIYADGRAVLRATGRINGALADITVTASDLDPQRLLDRDSAAQANFWQRVGALAQRVEGEFTVRELGFPTHQANPAFVKSPRFPYAVQAFFRDYRPRGRLNLELRLAYERGMDAPQVEGRLEALDAVCHYFRFPYEIDQVRGVVRFAGGRVFLEGLHGRHGSGHIYTEGMLQHTRSWAALDLRIVGRGIALDADLYAALPKRYKGLWQSASPIGVCDVDTNVRRAEGSAAAGPRPLDVRVDTRLLDGSVSFRQGGRLNHADGRITIEGGVVELHDIHGYVDGAPVRVAGTLGTSRGADAAPSGLKFEAADFPLTRESAMRDAKGESIGRVRFAGVGDIWGRVRGGGVFGSGSGHYGVHIKDGVLTGFDPAEPWDHARGWIAMMGTRQRILALRATSAGGWLEAAGELPDQSSAAAPVRLDLRAADQAMERLLRRVIPGRWARLRDALGLAGPGQLHIQFRPDDADATETRQAADVSIEAARMRPAPLPLDLRDVRGRLTLRPAGFELHESDARYGARGRIRVSGRGSWLPDDAWSEVNVVATDLEIDPSFVAAMPRQLAALLGRLSPKGRLNATLERFRVSGTDQRRWQVFGKLSLEAANLFLGLPLTEFNGEVSGNCQVEPDGRVELSAEFRIDSGLLGERPIAELVGRIESSAADRWVRIDNVRGKLCEGEVAGQVRIDPESGAYELTVALSNLSLDAFLKRDTAENKKPRPGRLDGRVFLRGTGREASERVGGGELRLRGASLLNTPIVASVARAGRGEPKKQLNDALDLVEIRFTWKGSTLELDRVDIHSRDLRLVGRGTWNLADDSLELTLLGAHPRGAPRVPVLTDLLESAGQELAQYRVRGTVADPRVTVEPLHNLTEPLRRLLKGDGP